MSLLEEGQNKSKGVPALSLALGSDVLQEPQRRQ